MARNGLLQTQNGLCRLVLCFFCLQTFAIVCGGPALYADDTEAEKAAADWFESKVRPILIEHCYSCHSQQDQSIEGGLRLDDPAGIRTGGNSGPAVVPGDSKHSLLVLAISHADEKLKMPPESRLSDHAIRDIQQWIDSGAYDPRGKDAPSMPAVKTIELDEKQRWAFRSPAKPAIPPVQNQTWPWNDIDHFIAARLEQAGLKNSEDASRRVWLRRVYFDLIGLPPTPTEIAAFESSTAADPYSEVVEHLLSSQQYGERWGRHWLDVVHYSDSTGCNSDFPVPQNYRYRNWVIDAIRDDMPYDQFVMAQLAGDLIAQQLPPDASQADKNALVIATGFVANARRFGSRHEDYPQHLTIEDTIDCVGKTFLGVSLACARCHDHKFDPITNQDYYGLYTFFHNTQYPWPGIETLGHQRDFPPLVPQEEYQAALQAKEQQQQQLWSAVQELEKARDAAKDDARKDLDRQVDEARKKAETFTKQSLPVETAYGVFDKSNFEKVRVQYKGDPIKLGPEVTLHTPPGLGGGEIQPPPAGSNRLALAKWIVSPSNPLTARVMVNRIWKHHFGVGIVPTPNDFGRQGKPASNAELLDYLAHRFIESGWSLKAMHRLMVLSHTYRQASLGDPSTEAADPNNQWLRGFRRQRLDAESLRDTLLVLGGNLDETQGGAHPFPPQEEWNFTQHNPFKAVYETNRRSVYVMTQRMQRHPYLGIFDGADPAISTAARNVSTTPLQALYLLNDEFVHRQAKLFAERMAASADNDADRIRFAFESALARTLVDDELQLALRFVHSMDGKQEQPTRESQLVAYEAFARSLFRLNEFVHVD